MKKKQYSLTAKQRRELREKQAAKEKNKIKNDISDTQSDSVNPELSSNGQAAVAVSKMTGKKLALIICACVLGAVLIVIAVILPFVISPYSGKNPVAKIELSNDMVLEFELYQDTCPIATKNFIFLARSGFFNGVIIFDLQNDWVRFGGYTNSAFDHRADDKSFTDKLSGFDNHKKYKLGYRLKKDTDKDAERYAEEGMLCFLYNSSSTEFQISAAKNAQRDVNGTDYTPTVFGRYLNDKTLSNLKTIAALPYVTDSSRAPWKPPVNIIKINRVTIYNYDEAPWRSFSFEKDMASYINYWTGGA